MRYTGLIELDEKELRTIEGRHPILIGLAGVVIGSGVGAGLTVAIAERLRHLKG